MPEEEKLHVFQCDVCGYVYRTNEEELPPDFVCPLCSAAREQFTKIDGIERSAVEK